MVTATKFGVVRVATGNVNLFQLGALREFSYSTHHLTQASRGLMQVVRDNGIFQIQT